MEENETVYRGRGLRSNTFVKTVALLLAIAAVTGACLGWGYCALNWGSLFDIGDYTSTAAWNNAIYQAQVLLEDRMDYEYRISRGESLSYLENQNYKKVVEQLSPQNTNFRYTVRDNATGKLLFSSSGEKSLEGTVDRYTFLQTYDGEFAGEIAYDAETGLYLWIDDTGTEVGRSRDPATLPDTVAKPEKLQWAVEVGVDGSYPVQDAFAEAKNAFFRNQGDVGVLYLSIALTALAALFTVFLLSCAGRRKGQADFVLNWSDRVPYDLYLLILGTAAVLCCGGAVSVFNDLVRHPQGEIHSQSFTLIGCIFLVLMAALVEAMAMSTATRCKTHTLLHNTLIRRLFTLLGKGLGKLGTWWGETFGSWPMTGRIIVLFLAYVLLSILTLPTVIFPIFLHGAVLFLLCRWVKGWQAVREGTAAIVGGAPETVIDLEGLSAPLYKDLREHAGQLNDLGSAINSAVEERMKSERMKAELITNVSHDLKTPLTSIINYVDLLKKEDIDNEKAREYIDVLDRKSQRLKKLTEDLVEASKASTGALPVNKERLSMGQLVKQALGEYDEKFTAAGLAAVPTLCEEEAFILADGRHVWRIVDNLLGNCVKYAMAGTRVYLDLRRWEGNVVLSVKNISAQPLNIPADRLMERFVRGDESRTTEGSGLGLSIARSLTELQGGSFRLDIDGDLFKATVSFPEVE